MTWNIYSVKYALTKGFPDHPRERPYKKRPNKSVSESVNCDSSCHEPQSRFEVHEYLRAAKDHEAEAVSTDDFEDRART